MDKTVAMNFDSCQVDFNRIVISQGLDSIRSLSICGNSDLVNIASLLDKCWGLRTLTVKQGLVIMEQLIRFEAKMKLPQLSRVCLSAHFTTPQQLENYIEDSLPNLDYLELSSVVISDKVLIACSKRIKQLVLFGTREYSQEELTNLASEMGSLPIETRVVFARDFPFEAFCHKTELVSPPTSSKSTPVPVKRKIPRKPVQGEIRYKQITFVNGITLYSVVLLVRL